MGAKYGVTKDDKVNWNWETKEEHKDFKLNKDARNTWDTCKWRRIHNNIEKTVQDQMNKGSCLAKLTSRPGQREDVMVPFLKERNLNFILKSYLRKEVNRNN